MLFLAWSAHGERKEGIFSTKSTHVFPTPNILFTEFRTEVCVTVTFPLHCGNPIQDPITMVSQGSFALFLTWIHHPNHFGGSCMLQNHHIKATISALPNFYLTVVTPYKLLSARSLSENAEVPTHLHNTIIDAKQGLISCQCVCVWVGIQVSCVSERQTCKLVFFRDQVNSSTSMLRMS